MKLHYYSILIATTLGISACKKSEDNTNSTATKPDTEYLTKANEATKLLATRLGSQLKAALQSGGPVAGITVCQQIGQPLTNSTNKELDGMTVTRTSLKTRNPLNAPSSEDEAIMQRWQKMLDSDKKLPESEISHSHPENIIVYKPIITQKVCTQCHGDASTFSPELISLIKKHYPNDNATGFTEGSLRGVFTVSFPK